MAISAGRVCLPLALGIVLSTCAFAEDTGGRWVNVEFPRDSPVVFVSFSLGSTTARVLRASMALDLHTSLQLRNTGNKTISGLTLRVEAQDLTPSGKGSVTVPSLNVQPGEVFPVRIDMELLRPLNVVKTDGALVQVTLDCALFSDFSYYGPDKLDSRRALTVYELEARRDRRYLARLLETGRLAQLREELNFGLQDLSPPQLGLELVRRPSPTPKGEQAVNVGAVLFPSSPVQPMGGAARVFGNEVRTPQVEVKNRSQKTVRSIEMGWIVRDEQGRDFVAGSVPASMQLGPVQTGKLTEPGTLRFSHGTGQPMLIGAVMAFVDNVEFADGNLWIPSRRDITEATNDLVLRRALASSPEQQRLAEIYRKKGINALAVELKRVN
ncbi:MAG: hypothetical protein QOD95_400 [Gammaproteobacteria bacterium]|jgi:hypothetical protein|nr:hypothetical protein [Gammaproteobacteria bacterium]